MSRRAVAAIVAGCVAATVAALLLIAANDRRNLAFTPDIRARTVVAVLQPGREVCQQRVEREAAFDSLALDPGTFHQPGPRLAIALRDSAMGRVLSRGVLRAGYADNRPAVTRVSPRLPSGAPIDVCVRNVGRARVAFYGDFAKAGDPGRASGGGAPIDNIGPVNIQLTFLNSQPSSVLSRVPAIFRRATIFRPGWVGSWTFWVLLGALVLAVPGLLVRALWTAERKSGTSG